MTDLEGGEVLEDDEFLHGRELQGLGGNQALLVEGGGGLHWGESGWVGRREEGTDKHQ